MSLQISDLKQKVSRFRVQELVQLIQFANENSQGKKDDLLRRANRLIEKKSNQSSFVRKVLELSRFQTDDLQRRMPPPAHQSNSSLPGYHLMAHLTSPVSVPMNGPRLDTAAAAAVAMSSLMKSSSVTPSSAQGSDLKMVEQPFYDIIDTIIKPTAISPRGSTKTQEHQLNFYLSAKQAHDVTLNRVMKPQGHGMWMCEYGVQIQLRLCAFDSVKQQPDKYPCNISLRVNNKVGQLPPALPARRPNELPRRPSRPIDITPQCRLSPMVPNQININWLYDASAPDTNPPLFDKKVHTYALSLWLVKALDASTLLDRLKNKGARHPLFSRKLIKEKLNREAEYGIELSGLRASLLCPVSRLRLTDPVRCSDCTHMQCFDASVYLQMNEKKPTWRCPVCDKTAEYKNLFIDGLMKEILGQIPSDTGITEIEFQRDGSWRPISEEEENADSQPNAVSIETTPLPKRVASPVKQEVRDDPPTKKGKVMEEDDFIIVLDSDTDSESEDNSEEVPTQPQKRSTSPLGSSVQTNHIFSVQSTSPEVISLD